jgi:hypothetical protein
MIESIKTFNKSKKLKNVSDEYIKTIDIISNFLQKENNLSKFQTKLDKYLEIIGKYKLFMSSIDAEKLT